jgi:hypothetical protein
VFETSGEWIRKHGAGDGSSDIRTTDTGRRGARDWEMRMEIVKGGIISST